MNLFQRRSVFHGLQRPINGPWALNKDAPSAQGLVAFVPLGIYFGGEYDYIRGNLLTGTLPTWTAASDTNQVDNAFGTYKLFDAAATQYLESSVPPVVDYPFTIAYWANSNDDTLSQVGVAIGDNTASSRCQVTLAGASVGDPIQATSVNSAATSATAATTVGFTANGWSVVTGVFESATSRLAYISGANVGTNTTEILLSGFNSLTIGARYAAGVRGAYFSGKIAHVCIWNRALAATELLRIVNRAHRWELYYRLGVKTFSFPAVAANTQPPRSMHQFRQRV